MAKGRKRKLRRRQPNGQPARGAHGPDRGTPEMQHMRKAITKDGQLSPDYPLSILLGHGLITPLQHDAGMKFAGNYWALFGKPFPRGQDLLGGGGKGLSAGDELTIRAEFEAQVIALADLGAGKVITDLCVFLRFGWLLEAVIAGQDRHRQHEKRLQRIRQALDALASLSVRRPGHDERERAEMEVST